MRSRVKLGLFLVALSAASLSANESRVVFTEAFDGTGAKPLGFTDACKIRERPPSRKRLSFIPQDNQVSDVHDGLFTLPKGTAECKDYELSFRFQFPKESQKSFTLTLVSGTSEDTKGHVSERIVISQEMIGFEPAASTADAQTSDVKLMPNGFWHHAFIRVKGKSAEVFVENDGIMRKFAETKSSGKPLFGFNFSGSTTVDFDDIEIRRIDDALPGKFGSVDGSNVEKTATNMTAIPKEAVVASSDGEIVTMDIPAEATLVAAKFRIGTDPGEMTIKITYDDGANKTIVVKTFPSNFMKNVVKDDTTVKEKVELPDAGVKFSERGTRDSPFNLNLTVYTRPGLSYRYKPEGELRIMSTWENFPAGSQKFIKFELRPDSTGAQIWIEGRYAGYYESASKINTLAFVLPANGAIMDKEVSTKPLSTRYLPLDVRQIANPGAMADAKPSLQGAQEISGIPFLVADGPGNADTGVCRENLGTFSLECDGYLSRTPFEGMPESLLLSVPPTQYNRAWALCAVEDDPDKVTVITARLTKFLPKSLVGRGEAFADTSMTLPGLGEPLPEGVKQVGEVKTGGKTLPLYLVEFKMDIGSIQQIIYQEKQPWLDFEILGKRYDKDNFYFDRSRKPSDDISGVHVFGATLERPPVAMWIMPTVFGNIYQPGEKPAMSATLYANEKASGTLSWTVHDIKGQELEKGSKEITFAKAGDETMIETPFSAKDLGWYSVDYTLAGKDGGEWLKHTAYFSLIAADTRKAGYESPYACWNFSGAHGSLRDINEWGTLLLKAGIRHTQVKSEEFGKPWKLTIGQFGKARLRTKTNDPEEKVKLLEDGILNNVETFPNATMALIFHESGGGPFPMEIIGGATEIDETVTARDKSRAESFEFEANAYRKLAPQIKLVVGNSGTATPGLMAQLFRAKVPREHIDSIGEETAGMSIPPEISVSQENWILKETARVFGYEGIPVNACFEWKCRRSRHLGLQRMAEWNARDILIAHAWNFSLIPTVALPDVPYSYYNSIWGDGAFTPTPQVYPKPGYAAVSTATLVLDCAKFVRMIPTGSLTVYALEFKRENEFIYAFWSARGELDTALEFEKDAAIKLTAFLGQESKLKSTSGKATIRVGEGAVYLTSPVALKAVTALGERSFPGEQPPVDAKIAVASKMDTLKGWELDTGATAWTNALPMIDTVGRNFRQPGTYELRSVKDEQKGDCLELELIKKGDTAALIHEYAFIKLTDAVALPGTPNTVGLWVKGNSSWGKIFWEIEDAEGEKWLSVGTGGYGCNAYDWTEMVGINFDGWHFLRFPLTGQSDVTAQGPGQDAYQWQHDGTGNRKIDYPIKLTGVAVSMPRQTINLVDMEPVETVVRLKNLSAY